MKIAIYQINLGRDHNRVAFLGFDELKRFQGSSQIDCKIYDKVFEGEVACKNLEEVFRMFTCDKVFRMINCDIPAGYHGRSLSVSDVVETVDENGKSTFAFCDTVGFRKVDFDPDLTEEVKEKKIKVVICEPGKLARVAEIEHTLEGSQAVVGGSIEAFYPFEEEVCIVCNEEGKFNGCAPNRAIRGDDGEIVDVIFGTFFICDCSGEDFGSLNEEQLKRYKEMFEKPENIFSLGGKIMAEKCEPEEYFQFIGGEH